MNANNLHRRGARAQRNIGNENEDENHTGNFYYDSSDEEFFRNNQDNYDIINDNVYERENNANKADINIIQNEQTLEDLLSTPQLTDSIIKNQLKEERRITPDDFKERSTNKLKEDLIYYFSSLETISKFKRNTQEQINNYFYYQDLDCHNFLLCQKGKFQQIINNSEIKKRAINNFNSEFFLYTNIREKSKNFKERIINANIIVLKMEEFSFLLNERKDFDEKKIMNYLNELKDCFSNRIIDMESLGLGHFKAIENNLIDILKSIETKFMANINNANLIDFIIDFTKICLEILNTFKSTKLYFYIVKFLKENNTLIEKENINFNIKNNLIQFIPNNCFDFRQLDKNIKEILIIDLRESKIKNNNIKLINNDYMTLYYDNYLLLVFPFNVNLKTEKNFKYYYYYKIDVINKIINDVGIIDLLDKEKENNQNLKNVDIIDVNFTVKKELIYIFYIMKNSEKYFLKYKIFNKDFKSLIEVDKIELKKSFIPKRLLNDNKYIYCTSNSTEIFMVKRKYKIDFQKYINCSFRLFSKDCIKYDEINDISDYKMYNSLFINNIFFLEDIPNKKMFIAKLTKPNINENENYILNIYEMTSRSNYNNIPIKIVFNDNKFIVNKIDDSFTLFYGKASQNYNHLVDTGLFLLPFNSTIINNNCFNNLYEYLIQEYSSFLNLCGNFEYNSIKRGIIIKYPLSFCCNFNQNLLNFIIDSIIENENIDNIKFNFIIILKQIICCLYNVGMFKEEIIERIIPYFKKLILNMIESKEKKYFKKIIKEILVIVHYIKNVEIIDYEEIKSVFDKVHVVDNNNINFSNLKSQVLLLELIYRQNKIQHKKELYYYIIKLETSYIKNISENNYSYLSNYYLLKKLMFIASECLFKESKLFGNELISLIPELFENIQILIEFYQKNILNKNLKAYSFVYNSFIFRSFYFIFEYLLAKKIFIRKKEYIIQLYKIISMIDKLNINYNNCLDMNNVIEIKNYYSNKNKNNQNNENKILNINFNGRKNIIIQTNLLSDEEYDKINGLINIKIFSDGYNIDYIFSKKQNHIYHNVSKINVELQQWNYNKIKSDLILNIIIVTNEKLYNDYKSNKDYKMISLIEKSNIQYLLYLFDDINSELQKYYNNDNVKLYLKKFENDIFKYISIQSEEESDKCKSPSEFNDLTNKLIKTLNKEDNQIENFELLNDELKENFDKINEKISKDNFLFQKNYEKAFDNISPIRDNSKEINCDKLFTLFINDIPNKNIVFQLKNNNKLKLLVSKIFLFGVKYYNYYETFEKLLEKIGKSELKDLNDIRNNANENEFIDSYKLFNSFYSESLKVIGIYHEHLRSGLDKDNFFLNNFNKIDFLNKNIIPCNDLNIKPNNLIIKNLIEFLDDYKIGVSEIKKYKQVQNLNLQIKLIELLIINNLLLYLNNENNIILILDFINKNKIKNIKYNEKLNSFFDKTYGVDYFNLEKLKLRFNLFMKTLSNKIKSNELNYSIITKISLIENLIINLKETNFPILSELIAIFQELKTEKKIEVMIMYLNVIHLQIKMIFLILNVIMKIIM